MNSVDKALEEYVRQTEEIDEMRSKEITALNYEAVIRELQQEEAKSFGIKKNESIIKFLRERFSYK